MKNALVKEIVALESTLAKIADEISDVVDEVVQTLPEDDWEILDNLEDIMNFIRENL